MSETGSNHVHKWEYTKTEAAFNCADCGAPINANWEDRYGVRLDKIIASAREADKTVISGPAKHALALIIDLAEAQRRDAPPATAVNAF